MVQYLCITALFSVVIPLSPPTIWFELYTPLLPIF